MRFPAARLSIGETCGKSTLEHGGDEWLRGVLVDGLVVIGGVEHVVEAILLVLEVFGQIDLRLWLVHKANMARARHHVCFPILYFFPVQRTLPHTNIYLVIAVAVLNGRRRVLLAPILDPRLKCGDFSMYNRNCASGFIRSKPTLVDFRCRFNLHFAEFPLLVVNVVLLFEFVPLVAHSALVLSSDFPFVLDAFDIAHHLRFAPLPNARRGRWNFPRRRFPMRHGRWWGHRAHRRLFQLARPAQVNVVSRRLFIFFLHAEKTVNL